MTADLSFELPRATATFLRKPRRFDLLTGLPLKRRLNSSCVMFISEVSLGSKLPFRGWNPFSEDGVALLFHGQTSWQISHPNIKLPIFERISLGIDSLSSIVKYEIQRRESRMLGSTIASVGQASMQRVQVPQLPRGSI